MKKDEINVPMALSVFRDGKTINTCPTYVLYHPQRLVPSAHLLLKSPIGPLYLNCIYICVYIYVMYLSALCIFVCMYISYFVVGLLNIIS